MIITGLTRGDAGQLANYLLNEPKNDSATLLETRGFAPGTLEEQLFVAEEFVLGHTRAKNSFFHVTFDPDRSKGEQLTDEQFMWGIERLEERLGLQNCKRVIVEHVFNGEPHRHVVWNHLDPETGKMAELKYHARARLEVAAEMEERFGLRQLNREGFEDRGTARQWEDGQDERSAASKKERSATITDLWNKTDSGKAFRAALEEAGYTIAHGKSRAYCVVDSHGEVHSLARQIQGANTAEVKARLTDLDPSTIPEAEDIRAAIRQARKEHDAEATAAKEPRQSRAQRNADREGDEEAIRTVEMDYAGQTGPEVSTPRERSEAERAQSVGIAGTILEALTWGRSTFTKTDLEREAARATGHTGRESWMAQTGGLDQLDDRHRASAERSYEKWADDNPHAAAKYGLADYVSYAQRREAERQHETDPAILKDRAEKRAAFTEVMDAIYQSGEIVTVGPDPRNENRERFTTRSMLQAELVMEAAAATLAERDGHEVRGKTRETVRKQTEKAQGFDLSPEQRAALKHVTGDEDIALVVGYAGAGKSTMLNAARGAWEAQGYRVRGAALSGIAARSLEDSAGINSTTLDGLLLKLDRQEEREARASAQIATMEEKLARIRGKSDRAQEYRNDLTRRIGDLREDIEAGRLTKRDVIVIDEAAMVGSRKMARLLTYAVEAGAKVVLVGDYEQTQALEAGAAFRVLTEHHGAAVMRDIRRQSEGWQREATKAFPEGGARAALDAYRDHDMTHEAATRDGAKAALVDAWAKAQRDRPEETAAIFTHLNADVHDLNALGRETFRKAGRLGEDHEIALGDGTITLAEGDRFLFRKNDPHLDVKNGSLGTVRRIDDDEITVALDTAKGKAGQGREVTFSTQDYQEFSHGYAATVHKAQGATVDRAFVLATPGMDKHTAYVAMSRHRERVDLFHAREDFKDHEAMAGRLSRSGAKDSVIDYLDRAQKGQGFASGLRAAVAGLWGRVTDVFHRGDHHPAETAVRAREQAERQARRPSAPFLDKTRRDQTTGPQQPGERPAPPSPDAAPKAGEPVAPQDDKAAPVNRLRMLMEEAAKAREAERKRRETERDGPGGRGR